MTRDKPGSPCTELAVHAPARSSPWAVIKSVTAAQPDELTREGAPPPPRKVRVDRGGHEEEIMARTHPLNPYRTRVDLIPSVLPELRVERAAG